MLQGEVWILCFVLGDCSGKWKGVGLVMVSDEWASATILVFWFFFESQTGLCNHC